MQIFAKTIFESIKFEDRLTVPFINFFAVAVCEIFFGLS